MVFYLMSEWPKGAGVDQQYGQNLKMHGEMYLQDF